MAAGPSNPSAALLTNNKSYTCWQATADNRIVTRRENKCRGNKVTDLLTYPASMIPQNTTYSL